MGTSRFLLAAMMCAGLTACKTECKDGVPVASSGGAKTSSSTSTETAPVSTVTAPAAECTEPTTTTLPPPTTTNPPPTTTLPPSTAAKYPLLWEASRTEGKEWSQHVYKVIREEVATKLLPGSSDVEKFCPRYYTLTNEQRINFWGLLISAVTKYESAYKPTMRYQESTMGTDPVTKEPVYSEGLLQLSYQDVQWAPFCEFDWSKDKLLSRTDPKKTIFDPKKNLSCGIKIFANMVDKKDLIAVSSGAYWAVLIPNGKYTQVDNIAALTKKMTGCQ